MLHRPASVEVPRSVLGVQLSCSRPSALLSLRVVLILFRFEYITRRVICLFTMKKNHAYYYFCYGRLPSELGKTHLPDS